MFQIYFYMMMVLMLLILLLIFMLIGVAFLTLMERKILSYIQLRKGPNKVGFKGLIQPFSDALKLLNKEIYIYSKLNMLMYMFMPIYMLILMLMMWLIYPFFSNLIMMNNCNIYLMCCLSLGVYGMMFVGWSSNSNYSMLGSIRSLSQSISYEVLLSMIILLMVIYVESFSMNYFIKFKMKFFILWPLMLIFFISMMAELNRTPFDFSEGESELVSGFNIEYMSGGFILIFLTEYSSMIFVSLLFNLYFMFFMIIDLKFYFMILFMVMLILWMRGTFPRFRYDLLMYLCWIVILPMVLNYYFFVILIKILV